MTQSRTTTSSRFAPPRFRKLILQPSTATLRHWVSCMISAPTRDAASVASRHEERWAVSSEALSRSIRVLVTRHATNRALSARISTSSHSSSSRPARSAPLMSMPVRRVRST